MAVSQKQRIDKWLWFARVVKTRTLAGKLVLSGNVRIDGIRITSTSHHIKPGDTLTIAVHEQIKILTVVANGQRRGPAAEAQLLYNDLSPPPPTKEDLKLNRTPAQREQGAGRPTKKQRRQMVAFAHRDPDQD
ncbi:MAG: RNA-binding S4 domain-containing protein [Cohaesibacteraceae bacterium]|nr:RNA-binding S4 domain-containing protein [Cohaesibacteraceae bacterium]MBL4875673.1 RNA-binding S4 domain-containing protein [Cohaesibacteraceae bacterium]